MPDSNTIKRFDTGPNGIVRLLPSAHSVFTSQPVDLLWKRNVFSLRYRLSFQVKFHSPNSTLHRTRLVQASQRQHKKCHQKITLLAHGFTNLHTMYIFYRLWRKKKCLSACFMSEIVERILVEFRVLQYRPDLTPSLRKRFL